MILVDTNIAIRLSQVNRPQSAVIRQAMSTLGIEFDSNFVIAPQIIYEMYVVITRPLSSNGFGLSPSQASAAIDDIRDILPVLPETPSIVSIWENLIRRYAVSGKRAHDVRLVAMMLEHGIDQILTFNDADFKPFAEIKAINPNDVAGRD